MNTILPTSEVMEKVDLKSIRLPHFSTLPTVKVIKTIKLPFDKIFIDDVNENLIRQHGITPAHVEEIKYSFSQGVDLNEMPPCVTKRQAVNIAQPYELVYGFNRSLSLIDLGQKSWYFTLIETDEDGIDDVRAIENEPLPKFYNKEQDIKHYLMKKINKGTLKNNENLIKAKLNQVALHRNKQSKDRILQWVYEDMNTPQKFDYWNKPKFDLWLLNHCSEKYIIGGNLDTERNMIGHLVKHGYEYRFIVNAIRDFANKGKHSYCIAHMGEPTKNSSIPHKRIKFKEEIESLKSNLIKCGMPNANFIHILGYLPQEHGIDDWKKLISPKNI